MEVKMAFAEEEYEKIAKELKSLNVMYHIKRKPGSKDVVLIFQSDEINEKDIRKLIRTGQKKHRHRNKEKYDDLGIEDYTPKQMNEYVNDTVTDLQSAKKVLRVFGRIILYLVKNLDDDT